MRVIITVILLVSVASGQLKRGVSSGGFPSPGARNTASIARQDQDISETGFRYNYETSDGTKAEQNGRVSAGSSPESGSLSVQGSFSYVGTDGRTYSVRYTADENGYRAEGAHLPTPPPVPEAIQRSLQGGSGQYSQQRSGNFNNGGYTH